MVADWVIFYDSKATMKSVWKRKSKPAAEGLTNLRASIM